jgi:2-oxo-4-hydroxy-4-carboxy--5-ureidoimidazoline (OHCU) decarboxylase
MDLELPAAASLSDLSVEALSAVLKPLFENSDVIASHMVGGRFASWDDVLVAAAVIVTGLGPDERRALLRGHARLGEDPAALKAISQVSFAEQHAASDDERSDATVRRTLLVLGQAYEKRFGFPFVEFVAGRPLVEIIPVLEARMENTQDVELATGLQAVVDIACDRMARSKVAGDAMRQSERGQHEKEDGSCAPIP